MSKISKESLLGLLVFFAEKFEFVKAVDVAVAVCGREFVSITASVNFVSKFSDIVAVDGLNEGVAKIHTNLPGIAGIDGALPDCYVEEFLLRDNETKDTIADFFNIFNNKILGLRYSFMKRHHVQSLSCRSEESVIGKVISSLSGFGFVCNNDEGSVPTLSRQFKIASQSLFWQRTRTADGIKTLLADFFEVPVKVKQFVGSFVQIDESQRSAIGTKKHRYNSLGKDCFLGNKVWDQAGGIDIEVGPLDFSTYIKFLPKQSAGDRRFSPLQKMKEIVRMYVPYGIDTRLCFYLRDDRNYELPLTGARRLNR
ncbi:MAG: type VI secretion system baseplate subunit TssG, partial [Holosporales bacterium]|nr:type VI secretion system baseplate subunit TssG [Holosporales bacterium]